MRYARVAAIALALLSLSSGLCCLESCFNIHRKCDEASATELASFDNAFGRPGRYSAPFCPKYDFTCKEMLCVEVDLPSATSEEIRSSVSDLKVNLRIMDSTDNAVLERNLAADDFSPTWQGPQTRPQPIPAYRFRPVRHGEYEMILDVEQPSSRLAETPHRVVAKYELCGAERIAVMGAGAYSAAFTLIGGAIIAAVVVTANKARRQSKSPPGPSTRD